MRSPAPRPSALAGVGLSREGHTSMTILLDSTREPAMTALRSLPDSRRTGADSPVIADSSTIATPSITVPSHGIKSPTSITTRSPRTSPEAAFLRPSNSVATISASAARTMGCPGRRRPLTTLPIRTIRTSVRRARTQAYTRSAGGDEQADRTSEPPVRARSRARYVIRVESPAWDGRRERLPRFSIHQVDVPGPTMATRTPSNQLERQRGAWLNESFRYPSPGVPRPLRRPRRRAAVGPMTRVAGGGESQLGGVPPASWWPCPGTG